MNSCEQGQIIYYLMKLTSDELKQITFYGQSHGMSSDSQAASVNSTMVDVKKSSRSVFSIDSILSSPVETDRQHPTSFSTADRFSGHDASPNRRYQNGSHTSDDDDSREVECNVSYSLTGSPSVATPATELFPETSRHVNQEVDATWLRQLIADVTRRIAASSSLSPLSSNCQNAVATSTDVLPARNANRASHRTTENDCSSTNRNSSCRDSPLSVLDEQQSNVDHRSNEHRHLTDAVKSPLTTTTSAVSSAENGKESQQMDVNYGNYAAWLDAVSHSIRSSVLPTFLAQSRGDADDCTRVNEQCTAARCSVAMPGVNSCVLNSSSSTMNLALKFDETTPGTKPGLPPTNQLLDISKKRIAEICREMMDMSTFKRRLLPEMKVNGFIDNMISDNERKGVVAGGDRMVKADLMDKFEDHVEEETSRLEMSRFDEAVGSVDRVRYAHHRRPSVAECFKDILFKRHQPSNESASVEAAWQLAIHQRYGNNIRKHITDYMPNGVNCVACCMSSINFCANL